MSTKKKPDADDNDEDELTELSLEIDKEGLLSWHGAKKWHSYWFILSGQNLYYKKRDKDPEVKGMVKLSGAKVEPVANKKEHSFEIRLGEEVTIVAADSPDTFQSWIDAIKKATQEPEKAKDGKKKQSRMMAIKKNLAGKAATYSAGKSLIKDMVGVEGVTIITQLKELIKFQDGKKKATEVENNILKIGVKVILLFQNKDITLEELSKPKDQIKALWSDVLDMLEISFCYDAKRLNTAIQKLEEDFEKILKPYLTEKSIVLLRDTMGYLRQESLLNRLYQSNECEKMRPEMEKTLRTLWDKIYGVSRK